MAQSELLALVDALIFDLFPLQPAGWMTEHGITNHLEKPEAVLKAAADSAPFSVKKLTRALSAVSDDDRPGLVVHLLEMSAKSDDKRRCLAPYIRVLLRKIKPEKLDAIVRRAFELDYCELYSALLEDARPEPSEATWKKIWPQVLQDEDLLTSVLSRYGTYRVRPPVSLELIFTSKGKLRPHLVTVASHVLTSDPAQIQTVWTQFLKHAAKLPADQCDEILYLLSGAKLPYLLQMDGFCASLGKFLSDDNSRKLRGFTAFWDSLAYLPEGVMARFESDSGYPALLRKIFPQAVDTQYPNAAASLALFLSRAPFDEKSYSAHYEEVKRVKSVTLESRLRECLDLLLDHYPKGPDPLELERQRLAEERKKLAEAGRQAQAREIENQKLHAVSDAALMQASIVSLQAQFQAKLMEINTKLPIEKRPQAMQDASADFQRKMAAILEKKSG